MGKLLDLRKELADAVSTLDLTTYTHIPGAMSLPGAFVMAGNPYMEQGQTFGETLIRFELAIATQTGDNLSETEALDSLIESAIELLDSAGWDIEQVSQPFMQDFSNASALVTVFTVSASETF